LEAFYISNWVAGKRGDLDHRAFFYPSFNKFKVLVYSNEKRARLTRPEEKGSKIRGGEKTFMGGTRTA